MKWHLEGFDLPTNTKTFLPEQLGWKRRTDLAHLAKGIVWELPDGRLYISPPGQPVYIQVLSVED